MERRFIEPAKPPLPAVAKRPFQPDAGSQTSNWMSESAEGLIDPVTLQKAGTSTGGPCGRASGPAATACALAMVVARRASLDRLSQVAPVAGAAARGRRSRNGTVAIMGGILLREASAVDGFASHRRRTRLGTGCLENGGSMAITELFIKLLETEAPISRRVLEQVPEGKADWKPHEKSMPFGYLTTLVASMPSWIAMM